MEDYLKHLRGLIRARLVIKRYATYIVRTDFINDQSFALNMTMDSNGACYPEPVYARFALDRFESFQGPFRHWVRADGSVRNASKTWYYYGTDLSFACHVNSWES